MSKKENNGKGQEGERPYRKIRHDKGKPLQQVYSLHQIQHQECFQFRTSYQFLHFQKIVVIHQKIHQKEHQSYPNSSRYLSC